MIAINHSSREEEDLWSTTSKIRAEDIRHMQSRVLLFRCTAIVVPTGQDTPGIIVSGVAISM